MRICGGSAIVESKLVRRYYAWSGTKPMSGALRTVLMSFVGLMGYVTIEVMPIEYIQSSIFARSMPATTTIFISGDSSRKVRITA